MMKNINEYFAAFVGKVIQDNEWEWGDDEMKTLLDAWNEEENQKGLANLTKTTKTTKTSEKKMKDPNKPKRGKSAYLFFCEEERPKVKASMGEGAKTTEVTKELGARWKLLSASTKKDDKKRVTEFEAKAAVDKKRYEDEMAVYDSPSEEELEQMAAEKKGKKSGGKKRTGKTKDKNVPKRPKSAYLFFCQDKRPEAKESLGDGVKPSDVAVRLGEMWNELKQDEDREDELAQYTQQAADDKKRYEDEIADYEPSDESEEDEKPEKPKKASGKKSSDKKASGKKASGKKKYNAYTFYASMERPCVKEEFPDMSATEVTKELARRWKQISEESKESWKQRAAEASE
jgi:hypothetical protein